MDVKVEEIKSVVNELNRRLNKKLNVISYDNLKEESRIETLLQVLKEIDPTVSVDTQSILLHQLSSFTIYSLKFYNTFLIQQLPDLPLNHHHPFKQTPSAATLWILAVIFSLNSC